MTQIVDNKWFANYASLEIMHVMQGRRKLMEGGEHHPAGEVNMLWQKQVSRRCEGKSRAGILADGVVRKSRWQWNTCSVCLFRVTKTDCRKIEFVGETGFDAGGGLHLAGC
jgi:hypothetical protein